ncbi:HIT family protein [Litorivita sp. NS0012-18]|uniref:HIT family protein n=1 Tax=Litorivita sp. NS0012-18 TaxID=3127655 RepID=UPI0033408652
MTCVFCSILAGDLPGHLLFQGDRTAVLLSLEGHPLIVPLRHLASLKDVDDETGAEIFQSAKRVASALHLATGCDGINLVLSDGHAAGQDVFHLHLHVKPRWKDDDVKLSWNTATVPALERAALANEIRKRLPPATSV